MAGGAREGGEAGGRTPSPGRAGGPGPRAHSPWTADRARKKGRPAPALALPHVAEDAPAACFSCHGAPRIAPGRPGGSWRRPNGPPTQLPRWRLAQAARTRLRQCGRWLAGAVLWGEWCGWIGLSLRAC